MRGNVIAFDHRDVAVGPSALQIEVVRALSADVDFTHMVLDSTIRLSDTRWIDERIIRT